MSGSGPWGDIMDTMDRREARERANCSPGVIVQSHCPICGQWRNSKQHRRVGKRCSDEMRRRRNDS